MKRLVSFLAEHRAALAAWVGLALLAQGVSAATARPEVVWPLALGLGAIAFSCAEAVIDWAIARVVRPPAEGGSK